MTNDSENDKWHGLHGQRIELALLQVDIVAHSKIVASEAERLKIKLIFGDAIKNIATAHGGKPFSWAGDGGSFMFLTAGQGFNDLVNAALEILDGMPRLNGKIARETGLKAPIHIRISCHSGLATYRNNADEVSGEFINLFIKNERNIGFPNTICITESVHQQLSGHLQNRFRWKKHSPELGCAIYELRVADSDGGKDRQQPARVPNWTFFLAPALGIVMAFVLPMQPGIVALEILAVILVNVFLSWRKSKFESTEDQDFVYTLRKNDLLAPKSGRPLVFQAKIVIVDDEANESPFVRRVDHDFKGADEPKDSNLILIPFTCHDSQKEADKRMLQLTLEGANAVVVVWTKGLRDKPWVYQTIDSWAFQRSDVPILFALADRTIPEPERYLHIPEDSKSLPWRLVQRGNERAKDWRGVASFNRTMVGNALLILLLTFLVGAVLTYRQKKATQSAAGDMFQGFAMDTRDQFLNKLVIRRDDPQKVNPLTKYDFHVSLWFSQCGEARQFASTEGGEDYMRFDFNYKSAIGAAFVCGTCVTAATLNSPMRIWKNDDTEISNENARMHQEQHKNRRLVVCALQGSDPPDVKSSVGICIFTNQDSVTWEESKDSREILRERTRKLFAHASPYLANDHIGPLPQKGVLRKLSRLHRCFLY